MFTTFTTLPEIALRDSYALWYTSSRNPHGFPGPDTLNQTDPHNNQHGQHQARQRSQLLERSELARLAADEQNMQRRRLNIQNYGSYWLKPPGVPKTLHQMREEKREQEEHQEAMRREQLAQELAEAEAEGMAEEGMMDEVQLDGAQDLDDEIPDADDAFGMRSDDEDDEEQEEDEDDSDDDADEDVLREGRQNDLMASRIRMNDDAFREALARGDPDGDDMYGGEEDNEEVEEGNMLDEDDFGHDGVDDGLDMDADLDDDIPEAGSACYEHTDSEAELTSSGEDLDEEEEEEDDDDDDDDDDEQDMSFAPRSADLPPPHSPTLHGRSSMTAPRTSMDLSNLLSQDGSSFMQSSPAGRRQRR